MIDNQYKIRTCNKKGVFRSKLKYAKEYHDMKYMKIMENWNVIFLNKKIKKSTTTNEIPYNSNVHTKLYEKVRHAETNRWNSMFDNLFANETNIDEQDIEIRMDILLKKKIQKLCNDEVSEHKI